MSHRRAPVSTETHRNLPLQDTLKVLLPLRSKHLEQPLPRLSDGEPNVHDKEHDPEDEETSFFDGEGAEADGLQGVGGLREVDFEAFDGPVGHGVDAVGGGAESL